MNPIENALPWFYMGLMAGLLVGVLFEMRWRKKTQDIVNEAIVLDRIARGDIGDAFDGINREGYPTLKDLEGK